MACNSRNAARNRQRPRLALHIEILGGSVGGLTTELKRSTAFHPQTDGSPERANRVLIEALCAFVEKQKDDWATLLPQLQVAANSSTCASTGFSPNCMMFGREMQSGLDMDLEAAGVRARNLYPGAREILQRRDAAAAVARENIKRAQAKQRADSAKGRREANIQVGDKVLLSTRYLRDVGAQQGSRKLDARYYGPYGVLEMRGQTRRA